MRRWYALLPGDFYALSLYPEKDNEKSARAFLRKRLGVKRLPRGTKIWCSSWDPWYEAK